MTTPTPDWNDRAQAGRFPPDPDDCPGEDLAPPAADPEAGAGAPRPAPLDPGELVERYGLRLATACARFRSMLDREASAGCADVVPWPGAPLDSPHGRRGRWPAGTLQPAAVLPAWTELHRAIGNLRPDRLAVLVAKTGSGKSAFALQVAEGAARPRDGWEPPPVLVVSLEMGTDDWIARLLALRATGEPREPELRFGVPWSGILEGAAHPDDVERATDDLEERYGRSLYLWAPPRDLRTMEGVKSAALALSQLHGGRVPFVVLDYVQRLAGMDSDAPDRRAMVSEDSRRLRDLARPGGLGEDWPGAAILAISSTARANYPHFRDTRHLWAAACGGIVPSGKSGKGEGTAYQEAIDLDGMGKESGELEYDAPLLLDLATDPPGDGAHSGEPRRALLVVGKARGPGRGACVRMRFEPGRGAFREDPWEVPKEWTPEKVTRSGKAPEGRATPNGAGMRGQDRAAGPLEDA